MQLIFIDGATDKTALAVFSRESEKPFTNHEARNQSTALQLYATWLTRLIQKARPQRLSLHVEVDFPQISSQHVAGLTKGEQAIR